LKKAHRIAVAGADHAERVVRKESRRAVISISREMKKRGYL